MHYGYWRLGQQVVDGQRIALAGYTVLPKLVSVVVMPVSAACCAVVVGTTLILFVKSGHA